MPLYAYKDTCVNWHSFFCKQWNVFHYVVYKDIISIIIKKKYSHKRLDIVLTFLQITFLLFVRRFFRPDIKKLFTQKNQHVRLHKYFYVFNNGVFCTKQTHKNKIYTTIALFLIHEGI